MLKRKKGYLLLTLLVITGLAGTLHSGSISQRERKYAATELRDSKDILIQEVASLSQKQLNYKATSESWSIKEIVFHLAISEDQLWKKISNALKAPVDHEAFPVTQHQEYIFEGDCNAQSVDDILAPKHSRWETSKEALADFRSLRNDHIRYIKTSTEGLREHGIGSLDCYQLIMAISGHSEEHIKQIRNIKATFGFPTR